jgi:hypothetical protein
LREVKKAQGKKDATTMADSLVSLGGAEVHC